VLAGAASIQDTAAVGERCIPNRLGLLTGRVVGVNGLRDQVPEGLTIGLQRCRETEDAAVIVQGLLEGAVTAIAQDGGASRRVHPSGEIIQKEADTVSHGRHRRSSLPSWRR